MTVQVPFPIPSSGYALNSKLRVNLDFIVNKFNEFNTGTATWDAVYIGTANSAAGHITLYNASTAFYLKIQAGATAADVTYTLPTAAPASVTSVLQSTTAGVLSWTATPTFTSVQLSSAILPNASNFDTVLKCHPSTATDYDFYFPTTNGAAGEFLTSDGTYCVWAANPVVAGLQTRIPWYHDSGTVASLSDHIDLNAKPIYVTIANQTAIGPFRTYTIPDAGSDTASFIMSAGTQTIDGDLTLDSAHYFVSNRFKVTGGTSGGVTIEATAVTTNHTLRLPANVGPAGSALTDAAGDGILSWAVPTGVAASKALDNLASVKINTTLVSDTDETDDLGTSTVLWNNSYVKTGYFGNSGSAGMIYIYPSTASKGYLLINCADNAGNTGTIIETAAQAGSRTYTIPDAGGSASFVMTAGTQTVAGAKTFSSDVTLTAGKNIVLTDDTVNTVTLALPAAVTSYTLTLPINDGDANQVLKTDGSGNLSWTAASAGATTALDNLASVAINTSLVSDTNNTDDLGTSSVAWKDLFLTGSIKNGATTGITISTSGEVTQPNQPSFLATAPTNTANVTGDGTVLTVEYGTEVYDLGADYNAGTYTFVAPVTGKYVFSAHVLFQGLTSSHTYSQINIVTSNRTYSVYNAHLVNFQYNSIHITVVADMDAADTCYVTAIADGSTKVVEPINSAAFNTFSGSLLN